MYPILTREQFDATKKYLINQSAQFNKKYPGAASALRIFVISALATIALAVLSVAIAKFAFAKYTASFKTGYFLLTEFLLAWTGSNCAFYLAIDRKGKEKAQVERESAPQHQTTL